MLKRILLIGLSLCLLFGITACSQNKPPEGNIQIKDSDSKDITAKVLEVWQNANKAYNVDDTDLFDVDMSAPALILADAPAYFALSNYEEVVADIFSAAGKTQFEQTTIGGPHALIQHKDGIVYRMGPWKSGVYFGEDVITVTVKEVLNDKISMTMKYSAKIMDRRIDGAADFTIIKVNDKWLVDDYVYPEATEDGVLESSQNE